MFSKEGQLSFSPNSAFSMVRPLSLKQMKPDNLHLSEVFVKSEIFEVSSEPSTNVSGINSPSAPHTSSLLFSPQPGLGAKLVHPNYFYQPSYYPNYAQFSMQPQMEYMNPYSYNMIPYNAMTEYHSKMPYRVEHQYGTYFQCPQRLSNGLAFNATPMVQQSQVQVQAPVTVKPTPVIQAPAPQPQPPVQTKLPEPAPVEEEVERRRQVPKTEERAESQSKALQDKASTTSRFHNLNQLFMYSLLRCLKLENMETLGIENSDMMDINDLVTQIQKSAQKKKKNLCQSDFFNHRHYNVLFLSLNKRSLSELQQNDQDVELHNFCFNVDIRADLDSKALDQINAIQQNVFLIVQNSLHNCFETEEENSVRNEYMKRAFTGIQQLADGNIVHRF